MFIQFSIGVCWMSSAIQDLFCSFLNQEGWFSIETWAIVDLCVAKVRRAVLPSGGYEGWVTILLRKSLDRTEP